MGGAKGGANFDPKGKSDGEIMRFCQAFMNALHEIIGDVIDVPAGDIGVGGREIGYMFGQYKRIKHRFEGTLTGKGLSWGGSLVRTEATGYGLVYFANEMLKKAGRGFEGLTCTVSGAGNVAIYTCEKLYQFGAKPVTVSDSTGYIYDAEGIDVALLKQLKEVERVGLREYSVRKAGSKFIPVSEYKPGRNGVWDVKCDAAFPCATQNEVSLADIEVLYNNGCRLLAEGANLPSTLDAMEFMAAKSDFLYGPGKAANAGGVATSGLEMAQNAAMESWSFEKVDARLQGIMKHIFDISYETSVEFGRPGDLVTIHSSGERIVDGIRTIIRCGEGPPEVALAHAACSRPSRDHSGHLDSSVRHVAVHERAVGVEVIVYCTAHKRFHTTRHLLIAQSYLVAVETRCIVMLCDRGIVGACTFVGIDITIALDHSAIFARESTAALSIRTLL